MAEGEEHERRDAQDTTGRSADELAGDDGAAGEAGPAANGNGPLDAEWHGSAWGLRGHGFPRARVYWHRPKTRAGGVAYGYHNAVRATDAAVEHDPGSPVALHVCPAEQYKPDPERVNVLVTMHESPTLAAGDAERLPLADWIVTPSAWCAEVYAKAGHGGRVSVAPLPVRLGLFTPGEVRRPRDPFRFFWLGSTDPRKGQATALLTWRRLFAGIAGVELYLKSTAPEKDGLEPGPGVTVDWRNLTTAELVELYRSADAFLFPSAGEGYGYPVVEAMACGVPVAATAATATRDIVNTRTAWPIRTKWRRLAVYKRPSVDADGKYEMAVPTTSATAAAMLAVLRQYPEALRRAREARRVVSRSARLDTFAVALERAVRRAARRHGIALERPEPRPLEDDGALGGVA